MRFLLDHNVPADVAGILRGRGHDVVFSTDRVAEDAPDPLVAAAAMAEERILVSHDKDFKRVARLISDGVRARFAALSRLHLSCNEVTSARRIESFLDIIEAEFACVEAEGRPMVFDLGNNIARIFR
jgi:predicted nuclease of predicted toxin-antitoxin system